MKSSITRSLALIALAFVPWLGAAVTFQDLSPGDLPDDSDAMAAMLSAAKAGHAQSQWVLAYAFHDDEQNAIAADLFRQLYETVGFDFPEGSDPRVWLGAYRDLGNLLLDPESGVAPDPELGLQLLARVEREGFEQAAADLAFHLDFSPILPDNQRLADAWSRHAGLPVEEQGGDEADEATPAAALGPCNNFMDRPDEVLAVHDQAQKEILEDPGRFDAIKAARDERLLSLAGAAMTGDPGYITLQLTAIDTRALFSLLGDLFGGFAVDHHRSAEVGEVAVFATDAPWTLVAAAVLEALDARPKCASGLVALMPAQDGEPGRPSPPFLILDLIRSVEPDDPTVVTWDSGIRYRGELKDLQPHGTGELQIGSMTWSGKFTNGAPRTGELRRPIVAASLGQQIVYEGPFADGALHGTGRCTVGELAYSCTFDKGALTRIGATDLLPPPPSGRDQQ